MRTIQYAIDRVTGLVISRVGSELGWPILDYPAMSYHLEKITVGSITGHTFAMLKWTKKINISMKNVHRKFWGFKLLK